MKRWPWIAFGLLLAAGTVGYWLLVHPWLAGPDEPVEQIDRRWARVERWARPLVPRGGPAGSRLAAALEAIGPVRPQVEQRLWAEGIDLPRLELADQPEPARRAIELLISWWRAGGGLPATDTVEDPACPEWDHPLEVLTIGRLALASAPDDAEAVQVEAVLGLAAELWNRGQLIHMAIGMSLSKTAVAWLEQRGLAPGQAFERLLPAKDRVFGGLARDSVCGYRYMADHLTAGEQPSDAGLLFSPDRELLWLRKHLADRLVAVYPLRADPTALAERLRPPPDAELPKSLLVRIATTTALPRIIARMAHDLDEIHSGLQRARRNPTTRREERRIQADLFEGRAE